ncbi:12104_t:CDS:2 [Ambispora gerdemannii]|uniref:12104_t:CDS:1 n=1 Tax=Ambispora gerdemannii TaxID=144530 RepID=A0A9N9FYS3_9GLOM|nr:12104_t:CDS:2 [Ambispora gerdemannii]
MKTRICSGDDTARYSELNTITIIVDSFIYAEHRQKRIGKWSVHTGPQGKKFKFKPPQLSPPPPQQTLISMWRPLSTSLPPPSQPTMVSLSSSSTPQQQQQPPIMVSSTPSSTPQ